MTEGAKFGANVVGVGVAEFVEDVEGLLPEAPGCGKVFAGAAGVAEVGEGFGFVIAGAGLSKQVEGVTVAVRGALVAAEVVVGVAEAVPGVCLFGGFPEFLMQSKSLPTAGERLLVAAVLSVGPGDGVEHLSLPLFVPRRMEEVEGLLGVVQRLGEAARFPEGEAQASVGPRLTDGVAELTVQVQGLLRVCVCRVVVAELETCSGDALVGVGLAGLVVQPSGDGQGDVVGGGLVAPVSAALEEAGEGDGQLPRVGAKPIVRGVLDGPYEHGALAGEPGQRLLKGVQAHGCDAGSGWGQADCLSLWFQQSIGGVSSVEVVVQQPVCGRVAFDPVVDVGKVGSVGAQQVVECESARCVLGDEMRPGQLGQEAVRQRGCNACQTRRRRQRDVRPGVPSE